ncbi:MAG: hypothetical protein ACOY3I_00565 [Verrucomicrobiota bacterium]
MKNRLIAIIILMMPALSLAHEHIIISGGPALRYHERYKAASHDKSWANFINSAETQIKKIKPKIPSGDTMVWMVYRPGYETRGKEEHVDAIGIITQKAQELGAKLVWFNNRAEFLEYLNDNRDDDNLIARLEYFGHSNKRNWMFDYSNKLDGASAEPDMFHLWHFNKLAGGIFTENAFCKSWGCHSGEQYSGAWYKRTGRRMEGAIGKTDYSDGGIPKLSSSSGKWTQ